MEHSHFETDNSAVEVPKKEKEQVDKQKVDAADPGYGFILDDQMKEELVKATQHIIRPESHIPNLLESAQEENRDANDFEPSSSAPEFEDVSRPEKVEESSEAERGKSEEKAGEVKEDSEVKAKAEEEKENEKLKETSATEEPKVEKPSHVQETFTDIVKENGQSEQLSQSKPEQMKESKREEKEESKSEEKEESKREEKEESKREEKEEAKREEKEKSKAEEEKELSVKNEEEGEGERDTFEEDEQEPVFEESKEPVFESKNETKVERAPPTEAVKEDAKPVTREDTAAASAETVKQQPQPYDFLQAASSEAPVETGPSILDRVVEALKNEDETPFQSPVSRETPSQEIGKSTKEAFPVQSKESAARVGHYFEIVADLLYWRDPRKSGAALGTILVVLLSLKFLSLISVVSYAALAALAITLSFRVYKNVMQAVQKTQDGHPFKEYLEMDINVPSEKVHETADVLAARLNSVIVELRRLFLVENLVDSLKFGLGLWLLTYVGAWFNGLTLVIFGVIGLFTLPKVYETHQDKIDQHLDLVRGKVNEITEKVQAVLPIGKKPKAQ